jgi:hypothetical protein
MTPRKSQGTLNVSPEKHRVPQEGKVGRKLDSQGTLEVSARSSKGIYARKKSKAKKAAPKRHPTV